MHTPQDLRAAEADLIHDLLHHKRRRDAEQAFVLEGEKPIRELLEAGSPSLRTVVVTHAFLEQCEPTFRRVLEASPRLIRVARARAFEKLTDAITPAGVLAVLKKPEWDDRAVLGKTDVLGLFGECIQDPANVASFIRTAAAFGMDAVWLTSDSADVFNPKVVRGTAGTLQHIPVFIIPQSQYFRDHACELLTAMPKDKASLPIGEINRLPARAILAFGNESRGLSHSTIEQAGIRFHIPTVKSVESLNVAASAAIAAFHFTQLRSGVSGKD